MCVGGDLKELPYLLMLMKLCRGDYEEQLHQTKKKVDEENGIGELKRMDDFGSFGGFQGTNSARTLGVFCQHLYLALGGQDW